MVYFHGNLVIPVGLNSKIIHKLTDGVILNSVIDFTGFNINPRSIPIEHIVKQRKYNSITGPVLEYKKKIRYKTEIFNTSASIEPLTDGIDFIINNTCKIISIRCHDYYRDKQVLICDKNYIELAEAEAKWCNLSTIYLVDNVLNYLKPINKEYKLPETVFNEINKIVNEFE